MEESIFKILAAIGGYATVSKIKAAISAINGGNETILLTTLFMVGFASFVPYKARIREP